MNKRQKQIYEKLNVFLSQFGAKIKDGEKYENSESPLAIENKYGLVKKVIANNIKRMTLKNDFWSFDGSNDDRQKRSYLEMKNIAEKKGGKLISPKFINIHSKLEFEDSLGYRFFMNGNSVKSGKWSPYEAKRVKDPEYHMKELRIIAEKRGGKLISKEYLGGKNKMEFQDSEGRIFYARSDQIKRGQWSPFEKGIGFSNEYYINELKNIAKKRGGKLISTKYINSRTKLEFEDRNGEKFWATSSSIKKGFWSPFEGTGISEEITRQCLEYIFNKKFLKTRKVLIREGKMPLELDGYNEALNIAFEYQGEQHYHKEKSIISNRINKEYLYKKINKHDEEKRELCKKKNIVLIAVKFFPKNIKENEFLEYILNTLRNHKDYSIFKNYIKHTDLDKFNINYTKIPNCQNKLKEIEKIVKNQGGELISKKYINNLTKLELKNEDGITFFKTYSQLIKGSWYNKSRKYGETYYLTKIREIAEHKGGKLISSQCENRTSLLEMEDSKQRRFFRTYDSIIQGLWSPFENKIIINENYYLDRVRKIAENKGGKLLSTNYVNVRALLEFEDSEKRKFKKSYQSIVDGVWTPFVKKNKKDENYYITQMRKIAQTKGGKLISKKCKDVNSVLKFKDANNNLFEEKYFKIIKGAWSPFENKTNLKKAQALNDFKNIVKIKNGKVLSKDNVYINNQSKLEIETEDGIRFFRSLIELRKGRWLKFNKKQHK